MFGTQPHIHPLPGCLIVHTTAGVYTLDPIALTPMPCKMLQESDSNPHNEDDGIPRPQFDIANCTVTVLSVFNIDWISKNKREQNTDQNTPDSLNSNTNGTAVNNQSDLNITSCVAMAINYRLIVMKITRW